MRYFGLQGLSPVEVADYTLRLDALDSKLADQRAQIEIAEATKDARAVEWRRIHSDLVQQVNAARSLLASPEDANAQVIQWTVADLEDQVEEAAHGVAAVTNESVNIFKTKTAVIAGLGGLVGVVALLYFSKRSRI